MGALRFIREGRATKLKIELVPSTVWFSSLYNLLPKSEWYALKDKLFAKEGRRCFICNSEQGPLSAHEFWEYDDDKHVQKLVGIHHLCNLCHKIKHIGFWCHTKDGRTKLKKEGLNREDLIKHFCTVNECTKEDFMKHEDEAFKLWRERSRYEWKQDFGEYSRYMT